MKNLLMSAAIGDIAGSAYEGKSRRTKDYDAVKMFSSRARFTDDTVLTFACAEAFLHGLNMASNLWMCGNQHIDAGFGSRFKLWLGDHYHLPYRSFGNGSAMRCSSAGWLAHTEEECIRLATETALPSHNPSGGHQGSCGYCPLHLPSEKRKGQRVYPAGDSRQRVSLLGRKEL